MYLLVCATEIELQPLQAILHRPQDVSCLVAGVGPIETSVRLTKFLAANDQPLDGVLNFGVAGAFVGTEIELLDLCLAEKEILGDSGICYQERIEEFTDGTIAPQAAFDLDNPLLKQCASTLESDNIPFVQGNFVTVCCASATEERGNFLQKRHNALCENMEGAAVARVCREFDLPCLEIRCISNLVEDRDPQKWKLHEATQKCAENIVRLLAGLQP